MRDVTQAVTNLSTQVNGQGTGQATLEGYGCDSTAASAALELIAYMNTVAWVNYGLAGQRLRRVGRGGLQLQPGPLPAVERAAAPSRR
jgi:hypothetical protein